MLLGPLLKVDIVQDADGGPVVLLARIVLRGDVTHHLAHGLRVLDVESFLVVLLYKLKRLLRCRDVTHVLSLLLYVFLV